MPKSKDSIDVVKGITLAIIFGALCWFVIICGGRYIWKNYIKTNTVEKKTSQIFDIERNSYGLH